MTISKAWLRPGQVFSNWRHHWSAQQCLGLANLKAEQWHWYKCHLATLHWLWSSTRATGNAQIQEGRGLHRREQKYCKQWGFYMFLGSSVGPGFEFKSNHSSNPNWCFLLFHVDTKPLSSSDSSFSPSSSLARLPWGPHQLWLQQSQQKLRYSPVTWPFFSRTIAWETSRSSPTKKGSIISNTF